MKEEKLRGLLPIGSVVLLREAKHALMIFGVMQQDLETKRVCDYIGVLWPEGNGGQGTQFLFNHEDITQVLFKGLNLIERDQWLDTLVELAKSNNAIE